jgi:hypothetical protein
MNNQKSKGRIEYLDSLFNDSDVLKSMVFSETYEDEDYRIVLEQVKIKIIEHVKDLENNLEFEKIP